MGHLQYKSGEVSVGPSGPRDYYNELSIFIVTIDIRIGKQETDIIVIVIVF